MKQLYLASKFLFAAIAFSAFASTPAVAANPAGPKPTCPNGQIAKVENGQWVCRPLSLTAAQSADPTASGLPQKPSCRVGLVAQWENGGWVCKELAITQQAGKDPTANQAQKPKCTQGKLPKFENGQWKCEAPDITSKPSTESTLLLPAVQKVREAAAK
ncbi:MAG: hypothetical protein EAZ30_14895 [Betaproteobacteria bacterium]|nr:MAG: hypothetical protein EAZ43_16220 [Betaproteobacteria bacterium]TAG45724.1 MAG: hypothetical protein EAZ30_14895 [Betaproteobacteria bacterium]